MKRLQLSKWILIAGLVGLASACEPPVGIESPLEPGASVGDPVPRQLVDSDHRLPKRDP